MKKIIKPALLILFFISLWALMRFFQIDKWLTLESLQVHKLKLIAYVNAHYIKAVFCYIGLYILVVAFNIPGAAVMTFTAAILFEIVPAIIYVNIGATLGGALAFIGARRFFGIFIQERFEAKLSKFNKEIETHGKNYLLTMRLIPIFPFFFVNIAAGVTKISLKTFLWTTSLGIIPGTVAYVLAGYNLSNVTSTKDILSPPVIGALVFLGVIAFVPTLILKYKEKK